MKMTSKSQGSVGTASSSEAKSTPAKTPRKYSEMSPEEKEAVFSDPCFVDGTAKGMQYILPSSGQKPSAEP